MSYSYSFLDFEEARYRGHVEGAHGDGTRPLSREAYREMFGDQTRELYDEMTRSAERVVRNHRLAASPGVAHHHPAELEAA